MAKRPAPKSLHEMYTETISRSAHHKAVWAALCAAARENERDRRASYSHLAFCLGLEIKEVEKQLKRLKTFARSLKRRRDRLSISGSSLGAGEDALSKALREEKRRKTTHPGANS
jgi:hypothetical protein